jgi:Cu/Ag efflux protein CusF
MRKNIAFAAWTMFAVVAVAVAFRVVADEPTPTQQLTTYSGIVRSIDLQARTITVDGSAVPQKFVVPTDAEINVKDKPRGTLDDLKDSDGVQVEYMDDEGVHIAHRISILGLKVP